MNSRPVEEVFTLSTTKISDFYDGYVEKNFLLRDYIAKHRGNPNVTAIITL
ncbi:hypothetical protein OKW21_006573 [Catalinimonas alkaloidigena]|uniref:hypothetical protein n=1 Tax=Catalinimonas alkaloidigena TaxID=1075417 RepID=UPI00240713F4|nr:hypothetical protein [Catalinimonas alkaloidigena]MDF9801264.1 hypothetical protein [Catalinimonas alkaloidigena]